MYDLIIKNGRIVDGTGSPAFAADLGIKAGRIAAVGRIDDASAAIIDAQGQTVSPGFIDLHSHADFSLPVIPTADSLVCQGITTVVTGQCGFSPAPLSPDTRGEFVHSVAGLFKDLADRTPWDKWSTFHDYLSFLEENKVSLNVAPLVGHGAIRVAVMGYAEGRADADQMAGMRARLNEALDAGAFGISTGLIYPPGSITETEELIELVKVAGDRGRMYFSHIRGENSSLLTALEEALRIGRETGAPVEISHFKATGRSNWDRSAEALRLIDEARAGGQDVTMDMYPYIAGSTGLVIVLPRWAQQDGPAVTMKHLADPEDRARMKADMTNAGFAREVDWSGLMVSSAVGRPEWEGRYATDLAAEAGTGVHEWIFDALLATELNISMILFGMSEDNRRREIVHPEMMIGTDGLGYVARGPLAQGKPHPRSYGTYPRILNQYVRREKLLTLEEAVRKMTGLGAARLGLDDRGLIKEGYAADLVVFDPDTIGDPATFENPHQYAEGISHVMVNGRQVVSKGRHTGELPGRVLRRT